MYRIGIDIGGTFTDFAAVDDAGRVVIAKSASTPQDPSDGLLEGLTVLAGELGIDRATLLAQTERIVHGTTAATNALLERKGASVALLTTEGHRDVIEMREGLKDDRYNVRMAPPVPLVPRARRIGVKERMRFDGTVATALSATSLAAAVKAVAKLGVDAIAVCYLHSYRNAKHEVETGKALAKHLPGAYVTLSSDVLPQIKENERVWTTVVNAYVGPVLSTYLSRLSGKLKDAGYAGDVMIMQSHGGVAPISESSRVAAGAVLSGPAGGVAAGTYAARLLGERNLITFDMGGTSTDIALLQNGEAQLTGEKRVGIAKVSLPALDIHTLGAGGGSIARVAGKILHVGPESAGADPGPACYGRGGTAATVTDANVVLGFLDPGNFLGGRIALDAGAAQAAVERDRAPVRHERHRGGGRHLQGRQHQHGGGHPHRLRPSRGGSAAVHAGGLRRRRRAARHGSRPPPRDQARRGAQRRGRAVGVGHAGHRSPLRDGAVARERGLAHDTGRPAPDPRCAWRPRAASGSPASRARSRCGARSTCATASRSSRSACRSTGSIWPRRT